MDDSDEALRATISTLCALVFGLAESAGIDLETSELDLKCAGNTRTRTAAEILEEAMEQAGVAVRTKEPS